MNEILTALSEPCPLVAGIGGVILFGVGLALGNLRGRSVAILELEALRGHLAFYRGSPLKPERPIVDPIPFGPEKGGSKCR